MSWKRLHATTHFHATVVWQSQDDVLLQYLYFFGRLLDSIRCGVCTSHLFARLAVCVVVIFCMTAGQYPLRNVCTGHLFVYFECCDLNFLSSWVNSRSVDMAATVLVRCPPHLLQLWLMACLSGKLFHRLSIWWTFFLACFSIRWTSFWRASSVSQADTATSLNIARGSRETTIALPLVHRRVWAFHFAIRFLFFFGNLVHLEHFVLGLQWH